MEGKIKYCGYIMDRNGKSKVKSKVNATQDLKIPQSIERPIQFASQTHNKTQQKYSQVDKQAFAIIFGVRKFHQYLFERKFTLITDNKMISQILLPNKCLPMFTEPFLIFTC